MHMITEDTNYLDLKPYKATREGFADALLELGEENPDIVVLDADLAKSTGTARFGAKFPDRFFDCGVAEQNMIDTAAGIAAYGKTVFTGSFAIFATGRAFEQIRNTVAYASLPVKICPTHSGITVGEDGGSHQTIEDIALMRAVPGMTIIAPADYWQAKAAIKTVANMEGCAYVRLGRLQIPAIYNETYKLDISKADKLAEGSDISIFTCGVMTLLCLQTAQRLARENISVEVINIHTIKPLDKETILESAKKTGLVLTVEEHSIIGGLGGAIAEFLSEEHPVKIKRLGLDDTFGRSGTPHDLLEHFGLDQNNIKATVKALVTS